MKKNRYGRWILLFRALFLVSFGIRGLITGDSRFGWLMFHEQVNYTIHYTIEHPSLGLTSYEFQKGDLRGKTESKFLPGREHQSRYGWGTVSHMIDDFIKEVYRKEVGSGAIIIFAEVDYQINKGEIKHKTFIYPAGNE